MANMANTEEMWKRLQLTEVEDKVIDIDGMNLDVVKKKGELSLIGKVWVDRIIRKNTIEVAMGRFGD